MKTIECYEYKKRFRFNIEFPKSMEIEPFMIKEISNLRYNFQNREWDDIIIEIYEIIGFNVSEKLIKTLINDNQNYFNFELSYLNPTGVEYERFKIYSKLMSIDLGASSYSKNNCTDTTSQIKLKIKPTRIEIIETH